MADSDDNFFGSESNLSDGHHARKTSFEPNLTNITEESDVIGRFERDYERNNEQSYLRLRDSFVASPNSYHFSSPPPDDETLPASPQKVPKTSFAERPVDVPPHSYIGESADVPPASFDGRSTDVPPASFNVRSADVPPASFNVRSADVPPASFNVRLVDVPPASFNVRSADVPPASFNVRSVDVPQASFDGRSTDVPTTIFNRQSTEVTPMSYNNRPMVSYATHSSSEVPPMSYDGRTAKASTMAYSSHPPKSHGADPKTADASARQPLATLDTLNRPAPVTPMKSMLSRTAYKSFADSPTFMNCTRKGFPSDKVSRILEQDRKIVYFGFRSLHSENEDALSVRNVNDLDATLNCTILPEGARQIFKLDLHKPIIKLPAGKKTFLRFIFTPTDVQRYKARCSIEITMGGEVFTTNISLLGFGGQASVIPLQMERGKNTSAISSSGRYQMYPHNTNSFQFSLRNVGQRYIFFRMNGTNIRDAFAYVVLQDNNGVELPSNKAIATPSAFWLAKRGANSCEKTVEVGIFNSPTGFGPTQSIGGSQRSLTSLSTRPPSTMDSSVNSVTQAVPPAFRILVFWGEERQRQRMKSFENANCEAKTMVLDRALQWKIGGENLTCGEKDSFISQEDRRNFISSIRYTLIQIVGRKRHSYSRNTSSRTGGRANTIIDMEPDDTLKVYESLCGDSTLTK